MTKINPILLFRDFIRNNPRLFLLFITPVVFMAIALGIYTQKNRVILPEFLDHEKQMAFNRLNTVTKAIEKEAHDLEMMTHQWMKKKILQAAFIHRKQFPRPLKTQDPNFSGLFSTLPLARLVDAHGRILFSSGAAMDTISQNAFTTFKNQVITDGKPFKSSMESLYWTIIPYFKGQMIVCAGQYPSTKKGTLGYLFLGKILDSNQLYFNQKGEDLKIALNSLPARQDSPQTNTAFSELITQGAQFEFTDTHVNFTSLYKHPAGAPLLVIKIMMGRDILIPVKNIARFASLSILLVMIGMWLYFAAAFLFSIRHFKKQRQTVEKMLGQTRDHFSKVFNSKAVCIAINSLKDGSFVDINAEFLSVLGYEKKDIIGISILDLAYFADDNERNQFIKSLKKHGYVKDFDIKLKTRDKQIIHLSISADLIQFRDTQCVLSVLIDISDRKYLEKELKKAMFEASQTTADTEIKNYQLEIEMDQRNHAEKLNQVLFDISNTVNTTRDLDDLYESIHSIMSSILTLDNFFIALYNKKKDKVSFPYSKDKIDNDFDDIPDISKKDSLTIEVIKTKKPILLKKKDLSDGGRKIIGTPAQVWLGVPLKINEEVIGVMATQSYTDPDRFSTNDIHLMETASDQIAVAIERKKSQEALVLSELKYRSIIESVKDGYCETDMDGNFIFFNEALCKITGYPEKMLAGMPSTRLIRDIPDPKALLKEIIKSKSRETDIQIIQKNGIKKHVGIRPAPIYDEDDQQTGFRTFIRDIDAQKKYEEKLVFLAYHDALTGLNNRKGFYEFLDNALKYAKRNQTRLAVMFMDIDKFKLVNDTLGHEVGDELLKTISQRLTDNLRETDFVSRIGGDEFTVVMTGNDSFYPDKLAKKILNTIRFPYDLNGHTIDYVSASIGISLYPDDGSIDIEDLVIKADQAMYEAKKKRDMHVFFKDTNHG